jgi:hypothetical protein
MDIVTVIDACALIVQWLVPPYRGVGELTDDEAKPAGMDEGTLRTPIPKCRLYWLFLFGVV